MPLARLKLTTISDTAYAKITNLVPLLISDKATRTSAAIGLASAVLRRRNRSPARRDRELGRARRRR